MLSILSEIKIVGTILLMLLLPGWVLMSINQYWKRWDTLQRWFLALSLGVATYPVIYYLTRTIFPGVRIGFWKIISLLIISCIVILWQFGKYYREQFRIAPLDLCTVGLLILILLIRFIIADKHPYLAGDDSLHHTLLTEITSRTGILPQTLKPYFDTPLDHYHLGLYSLTAPLRLLTGIRSDQALLWMSQFLNGIAGIGTYLILSKLVTKKAAIGGLALIGLFSVFPNFYVNWGRFTQLSGQVVLLPAAIMYWEHLEELKQQNTGQKKREFDWAAVFLIAFIVGATCFLHFRVAVLLLPLLISIAFIVVINKDTNKSQYTRCLLHSFVILFIVFLVISPALIPGLKAYIATRTPYDVSEQFSNEKLSDLWYYSKGDSTTNQLSENSKWLYLVCFTGILLSLFDAKVKSLGIIMLIWLLTFLATMYIYLTNINLITTMNRTAILLALYMPMSIGFGLFVHFIEKLEPERYFGNRLLLIIPLILCVYWATEARINEYWAEQEYMTDADFDAMLWIKTQTPADAVFAANTGFLGKTQPFGTDAGYWIPYYADRASTTLTLLSSLNETEDSMNIERARKVSELYSNPDSISELCRLGVDYLYSATKPPVNFQDFPIEQILAQPGTKLIYEEQGVQIVRLCE